ncbi:hypothetical protein D3C87_1700070 [compost metagenome]
MPSRSIPSAKTNGAVADTISRAAIILPCSLPYPSLPNKASGRVPLTILNRPLPMPKITAKTIAPRTDGAVRSSTTVPIGISAAETNARCRADRFLPKSMLIRRLAT